MKTLLAGLTAALLLSTVAMAADKAPPKWSDFKGVENTSFVEADGRRVLQLSLVVPAPRQAVWEAFTTEAGWKTWASPTAFADIRIGGALETSYSPSAKGDPNNIINRIEAYVPGRLLVLRNVQAPKGFPSAAEFGATVTVVELAEVDARTTRVTLTNVGYGQGPGFDTVYRHFEWGNAYSLDALRRRFVEGPVDWNKIAEQRAAARASEQMTKGD